MLWLLIYSSPSRLGASQEALVIKNLPVYAGDMGDSGSIPSLGRFPGGGHGNPLQYSCLENSMDRQAWWTTVHKVSQSKTSLKQLSMHALDCSSFSWELLCHFCVIICACVAPDGSLSQNRCSGYIQIVLANVVFLDLYGGCVCVCVCVCVHFMMISWAAYLPLIYSSLCLCMCYISTHMLCK